MVNTLEEFESLPESLVAEFVDGRIKVFDSLTSAQHEIRNELLVKASQYLKEAGLDACMALLFHEMYRLETIYLNLLFLHVRKKS